MKQLTLNKVWECTVPLTLVFMLLLYAHVLDYFNQNIVLWAVFVYQVSQGCWRHVFRGPCPPCQFVTINNIHHLWLPVNGCKHTIRYHDYNKETLNTQVVYKTKNANSFFIGISITLMFRQSLCRCISGWHHSLQIVDQNGHKKLQNRTYKS